MPAFRRSNDAVRPAPGPKGPWPDKGLHGPRDRLAQNAQNENRKSVCKLLILKVQDPNSHSQHSNHTWTQQRGRMGYPCSVPAFTINDLLAMWHVFSSRQFADFIPLSPRMQEKRGEKTRNRLHNLLFYSSIIGLAFGLCHTVRAQHDSHFATAAAIPFAHFFST